MEFTGKHNWTILPKKAETCYDQDCVNIYNQTNILLDPGVISYIYVGLFVKMDKGTIIQIQNHLCNKPWRIVNQYLCLSPTGEETLTLQVIANKPSIIKRGEVLCHIKSITFRQAFNIMKGTYFFIQMLGNTSFNYE